MSVHSLHTNDILFSCQEIKTLNKSFDSEARHLLTRAASQVKPIMIKRRWRVKSLQEFYPTSPSLLGLNINGGDVIQIRLRHPKQLNRFFSFYSILGTLLHELCHIECGPHNSQFYKLLNEITKECEELMAKGIFDNTGKGIKLSENSTKIPKNPRAAAAAAAEKRAKYNTMVPNGGIKLGGGSDGLHWLVSPCEMALAAAERRLIDNLWCSSETENRNLHGGEKNSIIIINDDEEETTTNQKKKRSVDDYDYSDFLTRKRNKTEFLFPPDCWACPLCTLINDAKVNACGACGRGRPTLL